MSLVVLTGASGSGKTAIADALQTIRPQLVVHHFDRIGVPAPEAMVAEWGSVEAWQRATTLRWLARIAAERRPGRSVLFEGQMRLAFVREGLRASGLVEARVVLVDCDDETRAHRLAALRGQPELASSPMSRWAAFLRDEAHGDGCRIMDTSHRSLMQSVRYVHELLKHDE